ncbi:MAG: hypothetical protein MI724_04180 [Spirochaetales bacterium]|nr:hypothetical protein [Spirochaetales bacterium]
MRTSRVGMVLIAVLVSTTVFAAGGAEEGDATRLVLGTGGTSWPILRNRRGAQGRT